MFRKFLIVLAATAAIGSSLVATAATAEAHHRRHHHVMIGFYPFFGFYPGYRHYYYDDYYDCGYRRVVVKKWNKSHTHLIKVYRKKWVCY